MREFLRHLFLPHHTNNYRAKFLHHKILIVFIYFLIAGSFLLASTERSHPDILGVSSDISIDQLLSLTNSTRQEHGLAPLTLDTQLSKAAAMKAQNMFASNYWAHVAPDGTTPWVFIRNEGYEYLYAGENLARGFTNAPDVMNAWMNSPGHRDNILSSHYKDIGFAVVPGSLTGEDTVLVVEMFGSRYAPQTTEKIANADTRTTSFVVPTAIPTQAIPTPTLTPQQTPTTIPTVGQKAPATQIQIAGVQNEPLINKSNLQKNIVFLVLVFFIFILILDMIIVKRQKVVRVIGHNIDHIIFFTIILITLIIITRASII